MLQRLYIHNFKCFQNFELKLGGKRSSLLIGRNGVGKSSLSKALLFLQGIGRGKNRLKDLVAQRDFFLLQTALPMRFELEVMIQGREYRYSLALELPDRFKELRVVEESLRVDGDIVYVRELAQVTLRRGQEVSAGARFSMDWHLIALPLIQVQSELDPVYLFKNWLAQMVILAPIPQVMRGETVEETLWPTTTGENIVDWLAGLLGQHPAAYTAISSYLAEVMPDLRNFRYDALGKETKRLIVNYAEETGSLALNFDELSDGEKCFFLCAVIIAANKEYGPLFCLWDEPDNFLSLAEVGHFIVYLRRAFEQQGQVIMTTHNEEVIRAFSRENTWVLSRRSHLEPTQFRPLSELNLNAGVIQSMLCGEL